MVPVGTTTAPTTTEEARKLAKNVNEEYHDPLDDWSSRDTLLSLVPFIVSFAFKDTALKAALSFGIAWAGFLLIMRTIAYDSRRKEIWPMLDLTTLISFAILRGLMRHYTYWIWKWWPLMLPLIFAVVAILTVLYRHPFVGHYARYPKFDRGGKGLWHGDMSFHRTCDMATLGWICAWSVTLLLALIPILTGHWSGWNVLNIIFCYVVPFVCIAIALILQQMLGARYRNQVSRASATTVVVPDQRGAAYPSGVVQEGAPATYATNV